MKKLPKGERENVTTFKRGKQWFLNGERKVPWGLVLDPARIKRQTFWRNATEGGPLLLRGNQRGWG